MTRMVLRAVVTATLVGAGAIHAAQAPHHLAEWWAAGMTFVVLAAGQAALGVATTVRTDRRLRLLTQVVSLATIGLWAVSRAIGLPVGPEAGRLEPVGRADLAAATLEAASTLACGVLLRLGGVPAGWRPGRSAVVALAVVGR
jgi:hypothetical protein